VAIRLVSGGQSGALKRDAHSAAAIAARREGVVLPAAGWARRATQRRCSEKLWRSVCPPELA
jgi:hypothetical protein